MKTIDDKFIDNYSHELLTALAGVSKKEVTKLVSLLLDAYDRDRQIFIVGNGGSFAIASHWVGDLNKTIFNKHLNKNFKRFRASRVPSTEAEFTAWANDVSYDMVFAGPLANQIKKGDVLIAISSSGNSPNIIKAVKLARNKKAKVIGFSGFDGGHLKKLADINIHIYTSMGEYEVVESAHLAVVHLITKFLRLYFNNRR